MARSPRPLRPADLRCEFIVRSLTPGQAPAARGNGRYRAATEILNTRRTGPVSNAPTRALGVPQNSTAT